MSDQKLDDLTSEVRNIAQREVGLIAAEFNFLDELKKAILARDMEAAYANLTQVGRAEKKVFSFLNKLDKPLSKLIEFLQKGELRYYGQQLKQMYDNLKVQSRQILAATSRYEGSLREILEQLRLKDQLLKKLKKDPKNNLMQIRVQQEVPELWEKLRVQVLEITKWTHALQLEIGKLDNISRQLPIKKVA
ncbi:hypothetical protein J4437_05740 [Candidatus Woesearchaeota archaeon]|nr:hypothetical protein [Candidatus Woesearchaeota archaeon]